MTRLTSLVLDNNRISDISALAGLTNLNSLSLRQNLITNLVPLQNLPQLSDVNVTRNLLDLSPDSPVMTVVWSLLGQGVIVQYLPQREPPVIQVRTNWFVAANSTALLSFQVLDDGASSKQLVVTASSSNTSLVPSANVIVDTAPANWILRVTPAANQTGTTRISLTATDDAGLSSEASIEVSVTVASNVSVPDPSLEAAIRLAAGKFAGDLTSVDLLALGELHIDNPNIANLSGLEWATNLTTLFLSGHSITSLAPLQNLNELASLSLSNTSVADLSPLEGLAKLTSLRLYGDTFTNYSAVLPGLTNLSTLYLVGHSISNLSFLENLTQLQTLILDNNRIFDLSPLAGLTNLHSLSLRQNLITNLVPLQNLPQLSDVDVTRNLLDLSTDSPAMTVVENLQSQGVLVQYLPQREPPAIEVRTSWFVAANSTALLSFQVLDDGASSEQLVVTATSSNTSLVPSADVIVDTSTDPVNWVLRVTPATNQTGTTTIFLTATNEAGLGRIATVLVSVVVPQSLENGLFNTNLTWTTYGAAPWFGQNFVSPDGLLALQSGALRDGEESTLETTLTGSGTLSFWWKLSSEPQHDWLEFYLDSVLQTIRISGEVDWQQQSITLPSGPHRLGWRYFKDPNPDTSLGLDAGWLAQIKLNFSPVLAVPADQSIEELSQLVVTNRATDAESPANTLTFELVSGPPGVAVNPTTGVLSWTPTEAQGPSTNTIRVKVTDNGAPPLSATNSFTVVVNEVNSAPVLTVPTDQRINEQSTLVVTNTATDPDVPANTLTFALVSGPLGVAVDSTTGVLTWTPTEVQGPNTNTITIKVTDNGTPSLSATNSFTVVVNEVNSAPVLTVPPNKAIHRLATLVVTNTATDPDLPANTLTFSLVSAPDGMILDSNTGVLRWTPSEAQRPSTNRVSVKVTDNGSPSLSDIESFTVVVNEENSAPILPVQATLTINELTLLTVTNTASDADVPVDGLTYRLVTSPSGASISGSGVITWTPTEAQGPSTNIITTVVTDNGTPPLSATNSFTVVVNEVNSAPALKTQPSQTINELTTLVLTNTATDADLPVNTLSFGLVSGPPGVSVNPSTGVLTWTPTEGQGPSTNTITVKVTDNGKPALSHTNSFTVVVNEVNTAPVLASIGRQVACAGTQFTFTNAASDSDIPANRLTYSLDPGSPAGAKINPTNGVFTWTPRLDQVVSTNIVTVRVTDNGVPSLSDAKSFTVVVVSAPVIEGIAISRDTIFITWSALEGIVYRLQFKSDQNELNWTDLPGDVTARGPSATKTDIIVGEAQRYYRVLILP